MLFALITPLAIVGKTVRRWMLGLKSILPIIAFIAVLNYFYLGLIYTIVVSFRLLNLISAFSIFFLTTRPDDMGASMTKLKIPYVFTFIFLTAIRYVPTLAREADDILNAYKARGVELEKSRWKNVKKYAQMLIPLFVCSIRRSLRLAEALEARAFGPVENRTCYRELKMGRSDYVLVAFTIFIVTAGVLAQVC
jgi:energy-coupling factor transport system permease protein